MNRKLLLALAIAPTLAAAATAPDPFGRTLFKGADPDLERFVVPGENGGKPLWFIYTTGMQVWTSPDLVTWTPRGRMLDMKANAADVPWLTVDRGHRSLWAPDMVAANGRYFLYFAVGPQNAQYRSEIGVAECASPLPPCRELGGSGRIAIPVEPRFEAIDPAVYRDPVSGKWLLYAGGSAGSRLRVFELSPDMRTIRREVKVEQPGNFTEGAFMHDRVVNGVRTYYLSYSNGSWKTSAYNVKYVTSRSPTGPWSPPRTILTSDARYKGPGHHAILFDPGSDRWIMAYHRWEGQSGDGPYQGARMVALARMTYSGTAIDPIDMETTAR